MSCENNKSIECTCPHECENHGKCCACVATHREKGDHPLCFSSKE